jgi:predicted phage baseplate assembly protein
MPITSPQLDDLTYDRTVEELLRRIPVYAPQWTDYNDSDPGVTLIQLFAYLAEQVGYRLNLVPEKNYIELLKLLGVELQPARAATTRLALLLSDPPTLTGYTLRAGGRARAKTGQPPPTFETDADADVVPAQMTVLVTTRHERLWDLRWTPSGTDTTTLLPSKVPDSNNELLAVAWDGKNPKLKDMPLGPVVLFPHAGQPFLWVGLNFNAALDAGFRGVRVTLTVQFDDDEQPQLTAAATCAPQSPAPEVPTPVDWLYYYDAGAGDVLPVPGRIDDTTGRLQHSGTMAFTVPLTIGAPPDDAWQPLGTPPTTTALAACQQFGTQLGTSLSTNLPSQTAINAVNTPADFKKTLLQVGTAYTGAVHDAIVAFQQAAGQTQPPLNHPLDPQLRSPDRVKGWLRLALPAPLTADQTSPKLRMLTFNAVPVTNARTETNEFLGTANGRPGQSFPLANGNVLAGTLQLAVQEDSDPTTPLVSWAEVPTLDTAGPNDRAYALDREAGVAQTGDGTHGRIVPLVPGGGQVVALTYRHGGGAAGNVGVAAIATLDTAAPGVEGAVNFVAAAGGRDAETLEQAKRRARKELSTRSRAVTAGDFEWIAGQTPGVDVARVQVVPLRRPFPPDTQVQPLTAVTCGTLATGPAGLDSIEAAGAVSVVVVPQDDGPEPVPTPSLLLKVCCQLNQYRLVTTEVHVVPPQYARLCNFRIAVKGKPGYTRSRLQDLVSARLATYLHVLTGGDDGTGFPFGGQLHVADLMAQVYRTEGVERVDSLQADFTRTKSNVSPQQGTLVLCPNGTAGQVGALPLDAEENVSVDLSTFTLSTVA